MDMLPLIDKLPISTPESFKGLAVIFADPHKANGDKALRDYFISRARNKEMSEEKVLTGRWRINEGILCCGTLRIANFDFDTDPSEQFKQGVYKQILDALNGPLERCKADRDGECYNDQCAQRVNWKNMCPLATDDEEC